MAKIIGVDWSSVRYGVADLQRGMKIELEHGRCLAGERSLMTNVTNDDLLLTARIALAHLTEHFLYYHPIHGLGAWEKKLGKIEKDMM